MIFRKLPSLEFLSISSFLRTKLITDNFQLDHVKSKNENDIGSSKSIK